MTWTWFAAQIEAALRLLRREPDAITGFDLSVDGFWRSFVAALVCLPGFFLLSPPNDPGFFAPSGVVQHPGTRNPNPFLIRAYKMTWPRVMDIVDKHIN